LNSTGTPKDGAEAAQIASGNERREELREVMKKSGSSQGLWGGIKEGIENWTVAAPE